jgi:hypothetical protein
LTYSLKLSRRQDKLPRKLKIKLMKLDLEVESVIMMQEI